MPVIPFGEYRPDVSDYTAAGQFTNNISNVVPRGDGYGPVRSLSAYSATIGTSPCRGFFYARKNDGTIAVFAGTSQSLYMMDNSALTWSNVSQGSSAYSALSAAANWQFEQFNKYVIAVQQNVPPQFYSLTSSTDFQDLAGSPPQAAYVSVVNRFLVLSGILSPNVYRIQWSGLNDINSSSAWTSGVNSSDYQDFSDGGIVRGVAGGEFGVIMQDSSIRRMTYSPGSPYVFGIDRIAKDDGIFAPYSLIGSGDNVFYLSNDGFKRLRPGGLPEPIGKERVDRTFFDDVDSGNLQLVIGVHDPTKTRVYWVYKSVNGVSGRFDKILCYDFALEKWSPIISISGEYMASLSTPGITLEQVDTVYGSNIDTISLASLDDIPTASTPALAAFDTSHKLALFNGPILEATLETGEQSGDGRLIHIKGARPVTDASDLTLQISKRLTPQSTTSYSTATAPHAKTGMCPAHVTTRYARAKVTITAASTWTFAAGVEPDFSIEGMQ